MSVDYFFVYVEFSVDVYFVYKYIGIFDNEFNELYFEKYLI